MLRLFIYYLIAMTLVSFVLMGIDKARSKKKGKSRIPEAVLFTFAVFGGSVGVLLGMYIFRHKTKHNSFRIGIPTIILAQAALIILFL
ncbi:MAG: DUF1294 domain-containing protein [Oscillospiraceae bacterium]|nr:DUF1294 domain-containing protein [Oscillospiraceae bacterium]